MWIGKSPLGLLHYRIANPLDPFIDTFDAGTEWYAEEVTNFFRSRSWVGSNRMEVIQFGHLPNDPAGLAAFRVAGNGLLLMVIGIDLKQQGFHDAQGIKIFDSAVALLAQTAGSKGCLHIELRVRKENTRALRAYERNSFEVTGTHRDKDGKESFVMRRTT